MAKKKWKAKSPSLGKGFGPRAQSSSHSGLTIRTAKNLMADGQFSIAQMVLQELVKESPQRVDLWRELADVSLIVEDYFSYEDACEHLVTLEPEHVAHRLGLMNAYIQHKRLILATQLGRSLLAMETVSQEPLASTDLRQSLTDLEQNTMQFLEEQGLSGEEGFEIAGLYEQLLAKLQRNDREAAHPVAWELSIRKPDFIPALNATSLLHCQDANIDQAIATANKVLTLDPHNDDALGNLTWFMILQGQRQEAKTYADRLLALDLDLEDPANLISFSIQAKALSYLGDDQGVLAILAKATAAGYEDGWLYHFAAAAALRLGQDSQAKQYWQQALVLNPALSIAKRNLDELTYCLIGERNAPYAFEIQDWMPYDALMALQCFLPEELPTLDTPRDDRLKSMAEHQLQTHPEWIHLAPILLERSDELGRELILKVAQITQHPELLAAVKAFAFGQQGSDQLRHAAATAVKQAGMLEPGTVRLWIQGNWRDIYLMTFEITTEAMDVLPPKVIPLLKKALTFLSQGNGKAAEALLLQALEIAPTIVSLKNNLASAYILQERQDEADALVQEVFAHHPDNVFARTSLARRCVYAEDYDQAEELLKPLFSREKFHISEYVTFCDVQVSLLIAKESFEGAMAWLDMWEKVTPDHPMLLAWQAELSSSLE